MSAKARMQINLMLSKVEDIKQVVGLREMAFPLFWFETVSVKCPRHRSMVAHFVLFTLTDFYFDRELINYQKM